MQMKPLLPAALIALTFFCGCRVIPADTTPAPDAQELNRRKNTSIRLGGNILTALQKNDYKLLIANIPGDLQDQLTYADFETSRQNFQRQFGTIKNFRFLAELKTPAVTNVVWIVCFERKSTSGEPIEQELLFRLVTVHVDNAPRVMSYGFF